MMTSGDVGTEIAPEAADDPHLAARLDDLLHHACSLARALTDAGQAALSVDLDGDGHAARKFFSLRAHYARWRDFRVDPRGHGLHGIRLEPGEVVRLTQEEVEAHPDWAGLGDVADSHPPMRGWLATAVCAEDSRSYGLLQLSDTSGGADFTVEDEDRMRELAAFTSGPSTLSELLDARGGLSHNTPLRRLATTALRPAATARLGLRAEYIEGGDDDETNSLAGRNHRHGPSLRG